MMQLAILHKIEQLFYKVLHILEEKSKKWTTFSLMGESPVAENHTYSLENCSFDRLEERQI